eukprot:UN14591
MESTSHHLMKSFRMHIIFEAILRLQEMSLVGSAGRNVVSGFVVGSALIAMRMEKWIKRRILLQKLKRELETLPCTFHTFSSCGNDASL